MRKRVHYILSSMLLLVCCLGLVACDAITAQKITNTDSSGSFPGMDGGGRNGAPGMNGRAGMNGRLGTDDAARSSNGNSMRGMMSADLTGKILSVDGHIVIVELVEQSQSNDDNNNNQFEDTGAQKTLIISEAINSTSDLKEGQIIMVWYKENTETVERISVVSNG